MINFTRAFDSAWERMLVILFRPFDFGKWFVIGFNAFLALLAEGGVAINNSFPIQNQNQSYSYTNHPFSVILHGFKQLISTASSYATSPWLWLFVVVGLIYLGIWLVLNWVGCRGQFMLLDNIVRNRAAVELPWHRYAHQGNVWFLFHIGLVLLSTVFFLFTAGVFFVLNWSWINAERNPAGNEIAVLTCFLLIFCGLWIIYSAVLFLIRSFAIPLYFKQAMGLDAALLAVARLTVTHPFSIACYLLINSVLTIAGKILTILVLCAACCVICWLACVPCLGTMLLLFVLSQLILPITIFLRCFRLDCLAQFGPQYDVWTVDVPPSAPTLQPPLG
jgi:hypothetical protein